MNTNACFGVLEESPPAGVTEETLRRICSEYLELPALRLTLKQAQRLWGLDEESCSSSLQFLVEMNFLVQEDDAYARFKTDVPGRGAY